MRVADTDHADLRRHLEGVPGWLSHEEAVALYEFARGCSGRGVIVEIGSFKGRSTICLGLGSQAGHRVPIYAIDPGHGWKRFAEFEQNITRAGVRDLVTPIAARSADAYHSVPEAAIELLFIDGSHQYDMVDLDYRLWTPRLVLGGVLVMHDTNSFFPGSCRVAEQRMYKGHSYRHVRFIYSSMTAGEKVEHATPAERVANHASLMVKRSFDLLVRARKRIPEPLKQTGRRGLRAIQHRPGGHS